MFGEIYHHRRVLLTGHTGFKGSYLALWLRRLGAEVCGAALPMPGEFSHFALIRPEIRSEMVDIRDREAVARIVEDFRPEIVFHLAAQPLVRLSYAQPVETFASNVMGTVHVLEACRMTDSVRAIVVISSDKCYENRERLRGYREDDPMGGYDPYSASKGCTELAVSSYRRSFFNNDAYGIKHHTLLASARAGNVIGGGDWAADRLVPDLVKAAAAGCEVEIRSPQAVRPWQHVLEPLSGYLQLGQKLLSGEKQFADGWNFGPDTDGLIRVETVAAELQKHWPAIRFRLNPPPDAPHEAGLLTLDCAKARTELLWHGVWTPEEAFRRTAVWYRDFYTEQKIDTFRDLEQYESDAKREDLAWTK